MKILFLAFLLLLSQCGYFKSLSEPVKGVLVSSSVVENAKWNREKGPYIIAEDISIKEGILLQIEAGVEVKVASGKKIIVEGQIEVVGSGEVVFTSLEKVPSSGDWEGIVLKPRSGSLTFCRIEYAVKGISVLEKVSSPFLIENNRIQFCQKAGLWIEKGSCIVENNTFSQNPYGIYAQGSPWLVVKNNHFTGVGEAIKCTETQLIEKGNVIE
jgi:parallel beta-helix repeat protein